MINPTFNPIAASLAAANNPAAAAVAAPAVQNVTPRPALPANRNEGARARDRRDTEEDNKGKRAKGERGSSTDLTV